MELTKFGKLKDSVNGICAMEMKATTPGSLVNHRIEFVNGPFDMASGKLVCIKSQKYMTVELCFVANMDVPFAQIVLHSNARYVDAKAVFDDACRLGDEIARRWNSMGELATG